MPQLITNTIIKTFPISLIGCIVISLVFSYIFSKGITKPILSTVSAVKQMANMDIKAQCKVKSLDEVGFLATNMNVHPLSSVIVRQNGNSVEQSYDNGVTWENYTYKETHDFFTYDEYAEWVKTEKEAIRKLVEAGEWTQKQVDEVVSHYNEVLSRIKDGLMVKSILMVKLLLGLCHKLTLMICSRNISRL